MLTYDLTSPLTSNTPVFPGDPSFKIDVLQSLEHGCDYNLCHLHFSNHTGTHIDFPAHVIKNGKTSSDFPIGALIGPGVILEYEPASAGRVSLEFVERNKSKIKNKKFVFFKSSITSEKPTYIEKLAADSLVQQGVEIVGVDSLSVDPIEADDLPAHHAFLSHDVLIIEGLNLRDVPPGPGEIIAAPLNIPNMDGLPTRVIMRR